MARLDAKYRHFWTTGKAYRHFWANSGDSGNANANGAVLTVTASIIPGTLSTGVTVGGATITTTTNLATGTSSGSANASGVGLINSASLFSGTASGNAGASGQTLTVDIDFITPPPVTDGNAPINTRLNARYRHFWGRRKTWRHFWAQFEGGDALASAGIFIIVLSILVEAQASADANVDGETLEVDVSLIPGVATAHRINAGELLQVDVSLLAGEVSADANVEGQLLTVQASVLNQTFIPGRVLPVECELLAGVATGDANAGGESGQQDTFVQVSLIPGFVTVTVEPQILQVDVSLIDGEVFINPPDVFIIGEVLVIGVGIVEGQFRHEDQVLPVTVEIVAGTASTPADANGAVLTVVASLEAGTATGSEVVPPSQRVGGPVGYQSKKKWEINAQAFGWIGTVAFTLEQGFATGEDNGGGLASPPLAPDLEFDPPPVIEVLENGTTVSITSGAAAGNATATGASLEHRSWTKYDNQLLMAVL